MMNNAYECAKTFLLMSYMHRPQSQVHDLEY